MKKEEEEEESEHYFMIVDVSENSLSVYHPLLLL